MIEYRVAAPDDYQAYLAFANMVFSQANGHPDFNFAALIPKAYAEEADMAFIHCLACDNDKGIRGLVAALTCDMHVLDRTVKTGYIGTVSVHPDARGEGHMKKLMHMQLERMRSQGIDVAFLGGLRQRYEYFGYVPGGLRWEIGISRANIQHALKSVSTADLTFTEITTGSELEAKASALHRHAPVWFDRSYPLGFATVCQSYNSRLYACCRHSQLIGYLVTNTSGDVIHEFAVLQSLADLDAMLKGWMLLKELKWMTTELPDWRQQELRHLNTWAELTSLHVSEQVRILRYHPFIEAMLRLKSTYTKLADGVMSFDVEGQLFTVRVHNNQVSVAEGAEQPVKLDVLTAGRLFCAPFTMDNIPEAPAGWFPLPVYVSEPDKF